MAEWTHYVDCPEGTYHFATAQTEAEKAWVAKNDAARITWIYGENAERYSKAIKYAGQRNAANVAFEPLTNVQIVHLLNCGLLRSDVEIGAYDDMERGHGARVRYLADEIERFES